MLSLVISLPSCLLLLFFLLLFVVSTTKTTTTVLAERNNENNIGDNNIHNNNDDYSSNNMNSVNNNVIVKRRIQNLKLDLWSRGVFAFPDYENDDDYYNNDFNNEYCDTKQQERKRLEEYANQLEKQVQFISTFHPVKQSRLDYITSSFHDYYYYGNGVGNDYGDNNNGVTTAFFTTTRTKQQKQRQEQLQFLYSIRGGGGGGGGGDDGGDGNSNEEGDLNLASSTTTTSTIANGSNKKNKNLRLEEKLIKLGDLYGQEFRDAIELNKKEHAEDCAKSCELFYCAPSLQSGSDNTHNNNNNNNNINIKINNNITFQSYSMGAVPPEDFADEFGFPLDLIKLTKQPLFTPQEALQVINQSEEEGLSNNEYQSGKYKLGGNWLTQLPKTRQWFNNKLQTTFFPLLTKLFPEIISSESVLRAHSVSLLKYNSSHPRTDIHIDNGILAMTIALTPQTQYKGGGTFYEHMGFNNIIEMDVGYGTFRPGSVRHGGNKVMEGTRYILGAFLLLEDRVEHVRRLKNRGSALRKLGDLDNAQKHFEWALAINPKCTTCLKDWAEILITQKQYQQAEIKIRKVLSLLENLDSDALFTLGLILSEFENKQEESIAAYEQSFALNNGEDAELCYNLGIKYGQRQQGNDASKEMEMYEKATQVDPTMGGAYINWGTVLAEKGHLDQAEDKFIKAIQNCPNTNNINLKAMMNLALIYQSKSNTIATSGGNLQNAKSMAAKALTNLEQAKTLLDAIPENNRENDAEILNYLNQYKILKLQSYKLMGQILAGLQDFTKCQEVFEQATIEFPNEPTSWHLLIRILEVQGNKGDLLTKAKERLNALMAVKNAFGGN